MVAQGAGDATQTTVTFPHLSPFVPDPTKPTSAATWLQQVEIKFSLSTNLTDIHKCALVSSVLDADTFDRLTRALLPDDVTTYADWDKFKGVFINLFDTKRSLFADRYKAFQIEWLGPAHESFQEYVARIRQTVAVMDCSNFSANEVSTLLLLMGMKTPALESLRSLALNALIKTPTETLANLGTLLDNALMTERDQKLPETNHVNFVKKAGQQNKPAGGSSDVDRWSSNNPGAAPDAPRSRCPGCDGAHWKKDCPYKNSKCYTCEGLGHIAKVCPNGGRKKVRFMNVNSVKIREPSRSSNGSGSGKKDESRYGTKVSSVKIYSLRTQATARRRYTVPVMIADKSLYFDFDSGSDVTVLSRRDYQIIGSPTMAPARIEARTASNSKMVFDGYFKTSVICSNIAKAMDIYVADISCSLLGLDFCDDFAIQFHSTGHDSTIAQVSSHSNEVTVTVAAPASATAIESSVAKLQQVAAAAATTSPQEMAPVMYVAQQKSPAADIPNVAAEHTSVIHARTSITIAAASSNAHQPKDAVDATTTSQMDQLFVDMDASSEGYCNTSDVTAQPYADVAQLCNTSDVTAQPSPCEPAASHLIAASRLFNANDPVSCYLKKKGRRPRKAAIVGAHDNAEQYRLVDTVSEKKKKNRPPDVQKKKARK
uniref:CCHC-type domain-containing protein n=1 Tax=Panagrolaimus davidi TaxID=227884 RepID=A0A914P461_9BILA